MSAKLTRTRFLEAVGTGVAWIALTGTLGCEPKQARSGHSQRAQPKHPRFSHSPSAQAKQDVQTFRSRPDLSPPTVEVTTQAREVAPGYVFVAPKKGPGQYGPMILDDKGQLVWFWPLQSNEEFAMDFKVQRYRGEPVVTWWEGRVHGHGTGNYRIFDGSYHQVRQVRAGNGYQGDLHEFLITPQGTALITIYNPVRADLTSVGGSKDAVVLDGIAQELDIETGKVLFEWHSLDHVDLDESYSELPKNPRWSYDYFHINSIDVDQDSNLLISARNTSAVYKIDRESGKVLWRLGGKKSDFEMGPGTRTAWQHDARRQPDGTITIFDNGAAPKVHNQSRGVVIEVDEEQMRVSLVREYTHPDKLLAGAQANMQVLPNGNVFMGWGSAPFFSEFNSDGELLFNAGFPPKDNSYRAFRFLWSGQPQDHPAVAAQLGPEKKTLYVSWNGATEVAIWEVLAGPGPERMRPLGSAPREGFETAITVHTAEPYVGVRAKHRSGRVLGTSRPLKLEN